MINLKNLRDSELLLLLSEDQMSAFEELYNRYWSKLYSNAYNRIRVESVSEEIVQDFFTSLWINRNTIRIHSSFNTYTYTAIRNLVFKYYQKEYELKKYEENYKATAKDIDLSTEQQIEIDDLQRILDQEVDSLPPKCKGVFNLSRKEHKTNKEIASILSISEKTVENHISKALRVLRVSVKNMSLIFIAILEQG